MPCIIDGDWRVGAGVVDRFPGWRLASLEAGGDWLPYMVRRMDNGSAADGRFERGGRKPSDYRREAAVYVSVEGDGPMLPQVIGLIAAEFYRI